MNEVKFDKINSKIKECNKLRDSIVNECFELVETTNEKEIVLDILRNNRLLGTGQWINNIPDILQKITRSLLLEYYEKYETVYYLDLLDTYIDKLSYKNNPHPDEVLNRYRNILICHIFDFVKKYKIIGTRLDW